MVFVKHTRKPLGKQALSKKTNVQADRSLQLQQEGQPQILQLVEGMAIGPQDEGWRSDGRRI
jgi:hypothetical protein